MKNETPTITELENLIIQALRLCGLTLEQVQEVCNFLYQREEEQMEMLTWLLKMEEMGTIPNFDQIIERLGLILSHYIMLSN